MTGIGATTKSLMQPISALPVFKDAMRAWTQDALSVLQELQRALDGGHLVDEDRIEELAGFYLDQTDEHWLLETQLTHWQRQPLSLADADDVRLLMDRAGTLLMLNEAVLTAITDLYVRDRPAIDVVMGGFGRVKDPSRHGTHRRE